MTLPLHYELPKLVAEIGCNHMGNFALAKELILLAKSSGCAYVKFQKRNNVTYLTPEQFNAPHPVPENSFGATYGKHREFLEFSLDQHKELMKFCSDNDIVYSTSVWDVVSAKEIIDINPLFIKVPSACNNNFEMLEILRDNFCGEVQISIGMTTKSEILSIVEFFELKDQAKSRLTIYGCTSGYPVSFEEACLLEISYLYDNYANRIKSIGYSGHHLGIAIDVAAYTLGARWIERHFTKDRTFKGTDHAASLEPEGLRRLSRNLLGTYSALQYKAKDILPIEEIQRNKLRSAFSKK